MSTHYTQVDVWRLRFDGHLSLLWNDSLLWRMVSCTTHLSWMSLLPNRAPFRVLYDIYVVVWCLSTFDAFRPEGWSGDHQDPELSMHHAPIPAILNAQRKGQPRRCSLHIEGGYVSDVLHIKSELRFAHASSLLPDFARGRRSLREFSSLALQSRSSAIFFKRNAQLLFQSLFD